MDPRYPIGKFEMPAQVTPARRQQAIAEIAATPAKMRAAVKGLRGAHLDTPYREGGWTVRQVVHHVPDSHLNAYVRLKLALTEDKPTRLWRSLKPEDFARVFVHPEHGERTVDWLLFLYEWHGKHHTAHITELRKQKGW